MSKILVTGASGFIGQYVVENLIERGHSVIIFDHQDAHKPHPRGVEHEGAPTVSHFLGDTRDYTSVSEAVAISDGVIHLAGVLGTQETVNDPQPAVETNILGGLNVFQAIRHYKVPAVYIAVGNHFMNNSYSITKTTAERFAFMFNKEHGTKIAVVRGLNVYGPRQKGYPVKKIMPNLILPVLRGEETTIYGNGEQVMDMIYVEDMADILVRALLEDHGQYDKVFEAGTGELTRVNDVAAEVNYQMRALGYNPKVNHVDMRPGETENSIVVGDPKTLLPLFPMTYKIEFTPLTYGIAQTIAYYESKFKSGLI